MFENENSYCRVYASMYVCSPANPSPSHSHSSFPVIPSQSIFNPRQTGQNCLIPSFIPRLTAGYHFAERNKYSTTTSAV